MFPDHHLGNENMKIITEKKVAARDMNFSESNIACIYVYIPAGCTTHVNALYYYEFQKEMPLCTQR